jgi:4,5-DOPA dioxygenase extradiol
MFKMTRQAFLKLFSVAPFITQNMNLNELSNISNSFPLSKKMPVLFIGHGHPMNALFDNNFTQALTKIGKSIEKPNAIMLVSAHWETRGTYVSVNAAPKTIYDFGAFDDKLFKIKYEPKGHPALAKKIIEAAPLYNIKEDKSMGLDHGAWTVLKYLYPKADVPVFQLSIDYTQPASHHFQLANALKRMREKGVLIIGSGNIVHNLGILDWNNIDAKPFDWAVEFDELVKTKLDKQDFASLINYQQFGKIAQLAIPSNDHYLPLMYSLGLADKNEQIKYLFEGHQYGSISMRCFQIS